MGIAILVVGLLILVSALFVMYSLARAVRLYGMQYKAEILDSLLVQFMGKEEWTDLHIKIFDWNREQVAFCNVHKLDGKLNISLFEGLGFPAKELGSAEDRGFNGISKLELIGGVEDAVAAARKRTGKKLVTLRWQFNV